MLQRFNRFSCTLLFNNLLSSLIVQVDSAIEIIFKRTFIDKNKLEIINNDNNDPMHPIIGTYLKDFFGEREQIRQNVKDMVLELKKLVKGDEIQPYVKNQQKNSSRNNKSDIGFEMMVEEEWSNRMLNCKNMKDYV
nr:10249_t:CDS:2 [Entrophospora candida]